MRTLDLNLATRPFKNNTLLWTGYVSGLVLLVAFSVWNVMTWRDHVRKLDELQTTVGSIEGQMADLERREAVARAGIGQFDQKALRIQSFKANEVIEWRVFSWTRLFNLMERIQPNNVRMTSIRPLFRAGRRPEEVGTTDVPLEKAVPVSVEGLAKDYGAWMELQDALLRDRQIGRVAPERLQRTDTREIVFDLTFIYHPDAQAGPSAEGPADALAGSDGADGHGPPVPGDEEQVGEEARAPGAVAAEGGLTVAPQATADAAAEPAGDAATGPPPRRPVVDGRPAARAKRGGQP